MITNKSVKNGKVLQNLEILAKESENITSARKRTFLGDVADALGAQRHGSGSRYLTIEAMNGDVVTIRLANHNATVSNFDHSGKRNGISLVISRKPNEGIVDDGDAHIVEFFYSDKDLRKTEGAYASIVRSIQQALYSGEYKDTTGLAERQEVNDANALREMRVWHGSGADFDAFDHSHMGEGEGAQTFGHGTYVTSVEGIGRHYAEEIASRRLRKQGYGDYDYYWKGEKIDFSDANPLRMAYDMVQSEGTVAKAVKRVEKFLENPDAHEGWRETLDILRRSRKSDFTRVRADHTGERHLYEVEIPDDDGTNYLTWDRTLPKEHRRRIAEAVRGLSDDLLRRDQYGPNWLPGGFAQLADRIEKGQYAAKDVVEALTKATFDAELASDVLSRAGFVGIEYPSNYFGGGNARGEKNYVIFNEGDLRITGKTRFLRTSKGEVLGFVKDGVIYLDPRVATAETPVHEYSHLS